MGLTIHYTLSSKVRTNRAARDMMTALHSAACDLPFDKVSPLLTFPAKKGCEPLDVTFAGTTVWGREVPPRAAYGFRVWPGPGCESADLGLAIVPTSVRVGRGNKRVRTREPGWRWRDFCKTQYASAPQLGGEENFLRCHLSLIRLLETAQQLGISTEVHDEGRYWQVNDRKALLRELRCYNEMIAGLGGRFKDGWGASVEGPIFQYSNFEHLEARGRAKE